MRRRQTEGELQTHWWSWKTSAILRATHTHTRPSISIFVGIFIDKLHYPAPYSNANNPN